MSSAKSQVLEHNIAIRPYQIGEEAQIVDFLNLCYGQWGTVSKWQRLYPQYPTFDKDSVFIIEENGEIVGHGGLHFRNLVVRHNYNVPTATLGDAAVHPLYRKFGLYARLQEVRLQAAKSEGACLALMWNLKGATTYRHNRKTGFVEIQQAPAFMKIMKPEKVLKAGLFDLIHKNERLREALQRWGNDLGFRLGESEFSLRELLDEASQKPASRRRKVEIVFADHSLPSLVSFRNRSKLQRLKILALLVLLRKVRIKIDSYRVLPKLLSEGVRILGAL